MHNPTKGECERWRHCQNISCRTQCLLSVFLVSHKNLIILNTFVIITFHSARIAQTLTQYGYKLSYSVWKSNNQARSRLRFMTSAVATFAMTARKHDLVGQGQTRKVDVKRSYTPLLSAMCCTMNATMKWRISVFLVQRSRKTNKRETINLRLISY